MPGQLIYTWKQTDDTVLICVAIPDGFDPNKLDITFTDLFVKVIYDSHKLQIDLIHEIDPFQSTYIIDVPGKNVNLTLQKASTFSWHKLLWKGYPHEVKRRREHSMNRYARRQEYLQQQQQSEIQNQQYALTTQILSDEQELEEEHQPESPPEHEDSQEHFDDDVNDEDAHTEDTQEDDEVHDEQHDNNTTQQESKSKKKKKKKKKKTKSHAKEEEKAEKETEHSSDEEKHVEPSQNKSHQEHHSKHSLLPPPLPAVSPLKSALKQVTRHHNGRHIHFDENKNHTVEFGKYDTIAILASHIHHLKPYNENHIFPDPDSHLFNDPAPSPPAEHVEHSNTEPPKAVLTQTDNNNNTTELQKPSEHAPEPAPIVQVTEDKATEKIQEEEKAVVVQKPEEVSGDSGTPGPKKKKKNKKKKDKQPPQQPTQQIPAPVEDKPVSQPPTPKNTPQQQQSKFKNKQPKLENADDYKLKASEAVKKGEYKTAIKLFTDAIAISNAKQIVPNLLNRALCHLTLLQHDQCIEDTSSALKLLHCSPTIPSNLDLYTKTLAARALVRRGAALCWSGRGMEAEKDFEKALELVPDDAEIREDLYSIQEAVRQHVMQLKQEGDKFFTQQQYQAALMMYTRCVNLLPTDARLFLNRALCYYNTMQFTECVSDCTRSLEILTDPNTPQDPQYVSLLSKCYVRRGTAYIRMQDLHNAAKDYQNALRIEPNNGDLKEDLKRIYSLIKLTS